MFQGSENFNGEYLTALEDLGATDLNGTTWLDRTNYFQTVPKNALDSVLWLESDRMGHFLGVHHAGQARRAARRRAEREAPGRKPALRARLAIHPGGAVPARPSLFLGNHRLDGGPERRDTRRRAQLVQGVLRPEQRRARDCRRRGPRRGHRAKCGCISATSRPCRPSRGPGVWIPRHAENRRATMQDRVPQARLYRAWTGPVWGSTDAQYLTLAAAVLAGDKNSRLYQRLVYRDRLASDVSLDTDAFEISGRHRPRGLGAAGRGPRHHREGGGRGAAGLHAQGPDAARNWSGSPRSSARHSCAASSRWAASAARPGFSPRAWCSAAARTPGSTISKSSPRQSPRTCAVLPPSGSAGAPTR